MAKRTTTSRFFSRKSLRTANVEIAPSGRDHVAGGDDRAPFVVLREEAELVGEIGRVDLTLAEHLHEVGLRHIDDPLHVLGRIETGLLEAPCAALYWLMLPSAPTPTFLPLSLAKSASERTP